MLVVLTFGTLMGLVVVSMMTLAYNLYYSSRNSSENYSDIQNYRAATELACYQYVTDLCSVLVTRDLESDWITPSGQAIYTQAVELIQNELASPSDVDAWYVNDITVALSAINVSDPSVLTDLLGRLTGVRQEFRLAVPEPLRLDFLSSEVVMDNRTGGRIPLEEFDVEVDLTVRGETVNEVFTISGLYLDVTFFDMAVGTSEYSAAQIILVEDEEGVQITRAALD